MKARGWTLALALGLALGACGGGDGELEDYPDTDTMDFPPPVTDTVAPPDTVEDGPPVADSVVVFPREVALQVRDTVPVGAVLFAGDTAFACAGDREWCLELLQDSLP